MGKTFRREKTVDYQRKKLNKSKGKKKMRHLNYEEFYFNPEADSEKLDEENKDASKEIRPVEGLRDQGNPKPSN